MAKRARSLTRALFLILAILSGITQTSRSVQAVAEERDCSPAWILCAGETLDLDPNAWWFPGVYLESGQGTGRLHLWCSLEDSSNCFLQSAEWRDGEWWETGIEYAAGARHLYMHGSGNLVAYDADWSPVWETGTAMGESDAYVNVHDTGCASIWHEDNSSTVWNSCRY